MSNNHYDWVIGGQLPELKRHSQAKHEILRSYLVRYIQTLVSTPHQDVLSLTIVDGFAGGGLYRDATKGDIVHGSPLIALEACEEAKALIMEKQQRRKDLHLDVDYFFVEKDAAAHAHLEHALMERGIRINVPFGGHVHVQKGSFTDHLDGILRYIQSKSRTAGKSIFILDQYSYDDVSLAVLNRILDSIPKAEIILTFNVGALLTFLNPENAAQFSAKTGMPNPLSGINDLSILKADRNWRYVVERNFIGRLQSLAHAKFFTPFFLRPERGHGDLWLVHLSRHAKANDVMKQTHWDGKNYIHYGGSGLDMLGYHGGRPLDEQISLLGDEYEFDSIAAARTHSALLEGIPSTLSHGQTTTFGAFVAAHCNSTPGTKDMIAAAAFELASLGEIVISSEKGRARRISTAIKDNDTIHLPRQIRLL